MSVHRSIVLGACFWGLLAAIVVLVWRGGPEVTGDPGSHPPAHAGMPVDTRPPEPLTAAAGPPAGSPAVAAPERPAARYPDGSSAGLLNGVTEPMVITWPDRVPFSPIVGTIRDGPPNHWEWYVHADGTHSTVAMFRLRPGTEPVPASFVRHPRAVGPMRATGDGRFVPVR